MNIAVIGLGKLGSCMAAVFADAGHDVTGVDTNFDALVQLRNGIAPVDEPGLQDLIESNQDRLHVSDSIELAVRTTDIAFVIVPTPSNDDGTFNSQAVYQVVNDIAGAVRRGNLDEYSIVVSSTVMPGTCEWLQRFVDDVAERHVPLVYSPEFIALGSVIDDMHDPDIVLMGYDQTGDERLFVKALRPVVNSDAVWHGLSLTNAELAKISVNAFVTMKISFANQLASICEELAGADAHRVLTAIGGDKRIGSRYLLPGGPFGGPCFPRDNRAFSALANSVGVAAPLAEATDLVNRSVIERIARLIPTDNVSILGLTYKTGTPVIEESLGCKLFARFPLACVHDPNMDGAAAQVVIDASSHVVIATPWLEYRGLDYSKVTVVDVWGLLPPAPNVIRIGVGS